MQRCCDASCVAGDSTPARTLQLQRRARLAILYDRTCTACPSMSTPTVILRSFLCWVRAYPRLFAEKIVDFACSGPLQTTLTTALSTIARFGFRSANNRWHVGQRLDSGLHVLRLSIQVWQRLGPPRQVRFALKCCSYAVCRVAIIWAAGGQTTLWPQQLTATPLVPPQQVCRAHASGSR
jgi:hypothetical protein